VISEETLTYFYYSDGLSDQHRDEVNVALKSNAQLAAQYARLCNELDQLVFDESPVSELLVQRLHRSLSTAEDQEAARTGAGDSSAKGSVADRLSAIVAIAATLILGFGLGVYFYEGTSTFTSISSTDISTTNVTLEPIKFASSTPFIRGLQVHLRNTRLELDKGALPEYADRTLRYQALLAVAGQNRMFERAAELNHASGLARVLRAFEPSLRRLAEEDLTPEQTQALHARLAFEIDVMLTKLSRNPSNDRYSI